MNENEIVNQLEEEKAQLQKEVERLRLSAEHFKEQVEIADDARDGMMRERDEARAEVERLTKLTDQMGFELADRYDAKAEIERLRAELQGSDSGMTCPRVKCQCGHKPHRGLCTARSGGTAYACGCSKQVLP